VVDIKLGEYLKKRRPATRLISIQPPITVIGAGESALDVAVLVELPDGALAIAQTSLVLFLCAADMLKDKYGDPRVEPSGPAA
jgi:hypothetical protein